MNKAPKHQFPFKNKIFSAASSPHIQRTIVPGAQLGCRVRPSELFGLKWTDVDLKQGFARVHAAKKNPNASWRDVPIREKLIPVMARWVLEDKAAGMEYLIHYRGKPVKK